MPRSGATLPFVFDVARLQADLSLIREDEWTPHYNERDYGGSWRGVALRSRSGASDDLNATQASAQRFVDTPLLERCAYFREILSSFRCPFNSVRLLSLAPGSFIREHSDPALGFEDGEVRIHVPIQTDSDVQFFLAGEHLRLEAGHAYYLNVSLPHRVNNQGSKARIHLVIDGLVNDWIRDLFTRSAPLSVFPPIESKREPNWIPVRVVVRESRYFVQWAGLQEHSRFTEPFFEETIRRFSGSRRETSLEALHELPPGLPLSGLIFHMSRCGSTLVSQMLAASGRALVISEAPPIDDVLQCDLPDEEKKCVLQTMVNALGQPRSGRETNFFLKLDAWHIHSLPFLLAAFPETPWMFLSRDAEQVIDSHLRSPGMHCLPGAVDPRVVQMTFDHVVSLSPEEWCRAVIQRIVESAARFRSLQGGLFVDYRELPTAVFDRIAAHFGIEFETAERAAMLAATKVHAKTGQIWPAVG